MLAGMSRSSEVFFQHTSVHNHKNSGLSGALGSLGVNDSLLHPDAARSYLNSGVNDLWNELWPSKYLHDINRRWNILKPRIAFFSEDFSFERIYGNNLVADRFEIFGHVKTRTHAVIRKADDGNGFAGIEYLSDRFGFGKGFHCGMRGWFRSGRCFIAKIGHLDPRGV